METLEQDFTCAPPLAADWPGATVVTCEPAFLHLYDGRKMTGSTGLEDLREIRHTAGLASCPVHSRCLANGSGFYCWQLHCLPSSGLESLLSFHGYLLCTYYVLGLV